VYQVEKDEEKENRPELTKSDRANRISLKGVPNEAFIGKRLGGSLGDHKILMREIATQS